MQDKAVKCAVAVIAWVVSVSAYAGTCYAAYELTLFMKDMPYGLFTSVVFSGWIIAAMAAIALESKFYADIYKIYCSCPKSVNI